MTQQVYRCEVVFTSLSAMVDNPTHTYVIEQKGTNTDLTNSTVESKLTTFYNTVQTGATEPPAYYLSQVLSRATNAAEMSFYDITGHLDGSAAGGPVYQTMWTLGAAEPGTSSAPEGACVLLDYRSNYGTDVEFAPGARPRARHRGRNYFGPIVGNMTAQETTTHRCVWASQILTDMGVAYAALASSSGTSDVPSWVQHSKHGAWVMDIYSLALADAPRYQRRRIDATNYVAV